MSTKKSTTKKKPKKSKKVEKQIQQIPGFIGFSNSNFSGATGTITTTGTTTTTGTGIYNQGSITNIQPWVVNTPGVGGTGGTGGSGTSTTPYNLNNTIYTDPYLQSQIRVNQIILIDDDGDEWSLKIGKTGQIKLNPLNKKKKTKMKLDIILSEK